MRTHDAVRWAYGAALALALFVTAGLAAASAATITIYGYNVGAIYTINPATGTATNVHTISPALHQASGLAVRASDGFIFYFDFNSTSNVTTIYRWNPAVPATAPVAIGTTGITTYLPRVAFGPNGTLYAMDQYSTHIYTISQTTGAATVGPAVSGIATGGGDMAFDSTGLLHVGVGSAIYSVPITGGAATSLGSATIGSHSITGMAFDSALRTIVSTDETPSTIYAWTPGGTAYVGSAGNSVTLGDISSIAAPDLQITSTHTGYFTGQGPAGTYTLHPTNSGNADTTGTITVVDTLPAGLTYVSAAGTGWTCGASGQTVTCTSSTVIAASLGGNTIALSVTASTSAIPSVTNAVTIAGGNEPALFNGNDSATDVTAVGGLTIVKTADITQVHPGDVVTFTLAYTNNNPVGGAGLQSIIVSDVIPANMTFFAASCTTPLPASLTGCSVTAPAVGGTGTVKFTFTGSLARPNSGTLIVKLKVV